MRLLVIDTADSRGSVAVFEDQNILHLEAHTSEEDYSGWLLPALHKSLGKSGLTLSQFDGYAVCAGPGSFTGLRVGLTTVKAWAEIYRKPAIAVSRLECLAVAPPDDPPAAETFLATFFDARREQIFAALYQQTGSGPQRIGEEEVISADDFLAKVRSESQSRAVRWRTPDSEVLAARPDWLELADHGHVLETVNPPFAVRLGWLALQKLRRGETQDALSLDADYVRRSDAETFWKGNKSAFKP